MSNRRISMKKLLVVVAFGTALATTAFAQQASHQESRASHQQGSSGVRPYEDDHYVAPRYERNNSANPDFQLGGER
jgi:hypothetical protein